MKVNSFNFVWIGIVFCILILTAGICSADDINVDLVSHLGGSITKVVVDGDYAYIGQGQDLVVLDINNVSNLSEVGRLNTPALISDVAVSGNYAYVIDSTNYNSDLLIVDISNPTSPTIAGSYDSAGNPQLVTVAGNYAYVTSLYGLSYGHETHLEIVDISNPLAPTLIGTYTSINIYDYPQDIVVSGNYAYVANLYGGLEIVNISNHLSPTYVGSYDTPTYAMSVAVADNYAYVGDRDNGLVIIDITDPAVPSLLSIYAGSAYDIDISGNYAYVSDGGGLVIVDISDSSNPSYVERYDTPGDASDVAVDGDYAYVADNDNGLVIVDISNPASPIIASSYATTWLSTGVTISGNYAYVADGQRGLVIVNITNPYTPKIVGSCYISVYGYGATSVAVAGNYAYVTDWANRLVTVDVSNPSSPIIVDTCDTYGSPSDIAILGNYAYLACVSNGLVIMDISNSSNPSYVTNCDTAGDPQDVTVAGNYAYVADGSNGLVIVNITNPYTPKIEGSYDTEGNAMGVAIAGDFAYIADGSYTVSHAIVDISNPSSPTRVGSYYTGVASDVTISGNYAYIAASTDGLMIVDITNLSSSPIKYGLGGSVTDAAISGDYAYVSSWCDGLSILHVDTPDTSVSEANMYISINAPTSMEKGNTLTYNFYYLNFGNTIAEDVVLEDTLPLEMEFISASDGGIYNPATRKITWNIGSVDAYPSGKGFKTLTVRIPKEILSGIVIENTASISSKTPETLYQDNSAIVRTLVTGLILPPGISVEPIGDSGGFPAVNIRNPITFTYQTNNSAVIGVNITIHLDDGGPDVTGRMKGRQTDNTTTWTYTIPSFNPRHGKTTVTYTVFTGISPYTAEYDLRSGYGNHITADYIEAYIKQKYPDSVVLQDEQNIGDAFMNATNYNVDPLFLLAVAELESGFVSPMSVTDGVSYKASGFVNPTSANWALSNIGAHNMMGWGLEYPDMPVTETNSANTWGEMVERVAAAIQNAYSDGFYTIGDIWNTFYPVQVIPDIYVPPVHVLLQQFPEMIEAFAYAAQIDNSTFEIENTSEITSIEIDILMMYIDPAGYIYNTNTGERIPGATVWLQRPDGQGSWENVPTGETPAISQPDTNPLITNNAGQYQWDVLEGTYRVHVEADGYYPADSILVNIPPPVTDLHVGLTKIPSANPPVANANGPYIGNEGSAITFDASGSTDSDGDVLNYRWDFNNDGIWDTFWQSNPTATYTLYDDFSGTSKVEVSDGTTKDNATASVTVTNVAPTVNAGEDKTVNEEEIVVFGSNITDPGSLDVLSMSWDFGDGSTVSHIPIHAYEIEGVYTVTLTVTDDDGGIASDTLIVTVNNVDRAPEFAPIGNKSVNETELLEFTISANDADGDAITYSATGLPSGANFDVATATFSWTPGTGTAGTYNVTFIATANGLNDSDTIIITVGKVDDWNPWNDLDSEDGESITLSELQEAIYDWRFGTKLSTGEMVDLTRLQELIYSWRFG